MVLAGRGAELVISNLPVVIINARISVRSGKEGSGWAYPWLLVLVLGLGLIL